MKTKTIAAVILAAAFASPATAGPYTDALGACLADSTTGKDRKELARWIFAAMSSHPEMRDLSALSAHGREQVFRSAGVLVTRLLSESCAQQARAAMKNEGPSSFEFAFGTLGRLAMQELMTNAEVRASVSGFERYVDRKKIDSTINGR